MEVNMEKKNPQFQNTGLRYDLVISGGRVIDPASGVDAVQWVGIKDGKIAEISEEKLSAANVIDASGLVISPGFIDIHSHTDGLPHAGECNVRMGVTTVVTGNCGYTFAPEGLHVKEFFDRLDQGYPVNTAFLVGASDIRKAVGADPYKPLPDEDIPKMLRLAEKALHEGAIGLSFGIEYSPGTSRKELIALGEFAHSIGIICPVHIRSSGGGLPFIKTSAIQAIDEILWAARKTRARFHISHIGGQIALASRPYDALTKKGIERVEQAIRDGLEIQSDLHPYTAWGTWVSAPLLDLFLKPQPMPWIIQHGFFLNLGMVEVGTGPYQGEKLTQNLLRQIRKEDPHTMVVGHMFREDLLFHVLCKPWVMVCSDGDFDVKTGAPSHPRCCGAFPRVLQVLVRERNLLSLNEALRKMTIMPAERFGLKAKGRLSVGADADITIFDPRRIADKATYQQPDTAPEGIEYVLIGGEPAVFKGESLRVNLGKPIRHTG
jgi:N-acyl-D-amino-acid deacylase